MSKELTAAKKILEMLKPELSHRFAVNSIGLFGSIVRDDYNAKSDIDIMVTFDRPVGNVLCRDCFVPRKDGLY